MTPENFILVSTKEDAYILALTYYLRTKNNQINEALSALDENKLKLTDEEVERKVSLIDQKKFIQQTQKFPQSLKDLKIFNDNFDDHINPHIVKTFEKIINDNNKIQVKKGVFIHEEGIPSFSYRSELKPSTPRITHHDHGFKIEIPEECFNIKLGYEPEIIIEREHGDEDSINANKYRYFSDKGYCIYKDFDNEAQAREDTTEVSMNPSQHFYTETAPRSFDQVRVHTVFSYDKKDKIGSFLESHEQNNLIMTSNNFPSNKKRKNSEKEDTQFSLTMAIQFLESSRDNKKSIKLSGENLESIALIFVAFETISQAKYSPYKIDLNLIKIPQELTEEVKDKARKKFLSSSEFVEDFFNVHYPPRDVPDEKKIPDSKINQQEKEELDLKIKQNVPSGLKKNWKEKLVSLKTVQNRSEEKKQDEPSSSSFKNN